MALHQHTEDTEESNSSQEQQVELIEAALRFSGRRDLILGAAFANPAWEIMLRLYLAALNGNDVPLETLVRATDRSQVTKRWLDSLAQDGLAQIVSPAGIPMVRLTTYGKASLDALFASAHAGTAVG